MPVSEIVLLMAGNKWYKEPIECIAFDIVHTSSVRRAS